MKNKILILDNIRSAENVGAIFRTCDAVGIEEIILSGTTPDPIDRFGRPNPKVAKSALGAEKTISWRHANETLVEVEKLKKDGYQIIAIELAENSTDYKKVSPEEKVVFILGSETDGISKNILDISDIIAEIPMQGNKESLNVSVSAGIALFRILGV
ncbi:MAG: TrmH family RNA methyltransferase [Candidatus Pacebacteria bacterium]|nr:TrmH family RNA methyltransferase [Candidatus Paceibacterota bacterium]MBP9772258.1 TrmH family RNA methyltransferase [Candidatus Paceibacterota bacterium]QQR76895.1 MAG: TrmH family RNA methyltransferase [Candidatus Nomurabacteria bacterium]